MGSYALNPTGGVAVIAMINLEIPLGKRTPMYRFFEMLPALLSYGAFILLFVLAFFSPLLAAIYLLLIWSWRV